MNNTEKIAEIREQCKSIRQEVKEHTVGGLAMAPAYYAESAVTDYLLSEVECLTAELEQKTRELERSIKLPCKVGDKIFSLRWNTKNEKYEVHTSEIKNVRYDSSDGSVMVSDGERFYVWGKTAFLTRIEAEAVLSAEGVE